MRNTAIAFSLVLSLCLSACTIVRLKQDLDQMEHLGTVMGQVTTPSGTTDGVYTVLFDECLAGPEVVGVDSLSTAISRFGFVLDTERRYTVAAFHDLNGDLKRNPGEPAAMLGAPGSLTIGPGERLEGQDIKLRADVPMPSGYDLNLNGINLETLEDLPLIAGEIISLDAPIFGQEYAKDGINPIMPYSNDSVVSVGSQLAPFAQEQAVRLFGYDLDHAEILMDEAVLERYAAILDRRAAELRAGSPSGTQ